MNEQLSCHILKEKYGDFTPVRLMGGYTNETFLLRGTHPLLVAKVVHSSNEDIRNELKALRITQDTDVVPKIFDFLEVAHFQIVVMEYRVGENGQSILDKGDLERTKKVYKSLGETLSKKIHAINYKFNANGIRESNVIGLNLDLDFVPDTLKKSSQETLRKIDENKAEWVLTHGDFGIHNVLATTTNQLTVLDWEWSEWANPLTDIGWVFWFTKLHYPVHAKELSKLFLEAYTSNNTVDLAPEKVKAYCIYKVWKVLNKVKTASPDVQQEWVRRLVWTLETDLFT